VFWVLEHLADLEADFRAFYRMDPEDILSMSGPRFFALAHRVGAYDGVMAARLAEAAPQGTSGGRSSGAQNTTVESTQTAIRADPALSGLIDW
jgi:hypothetical protein